MTPREAAEKAMEVFKKNIEEMHIDDKLCAIEEFVQDMDELEEELRNS